MDVSKVEMPYRSASGSQEGEKCHLCFNSGKRYRQLESHISRYHPEETPLSVVVPYTTPTNNLKTIEIFKSPKSGDIKSAFSWVYVCPGYRCGAGFSSGIDLQDHYLEVHYGISPPVRNPGAFESRVESPHNPWEAFGFDLSLVMDTRPANDTRPFVIQFLESISCPTGVKSESYDYQKHVKVFEKFGLRRHEDFKRVIGPGLDCVEQIGMELKKDGLPPFR